MVDEYAIISVLFLCLKDGSCRFLRDPVKLNFEIAGEVG